MLKLRVRLLRNRDGVPLAGSAFNSEQTATGLGTGGFGPGKLFQLLWHDLLKGMGAPPPLKLFDYAWALGGSANDIKKFKEVLGSPVFVCG